LKDAPAPFLDQLNIHGKRFRVNQALEMFTLGPQALTSPKTAGFIPDYPAPQ
jgi:hypothetical protein